MDKEEVIKFEKVSKKFKRGRKLLLKEALIDVFKPQSSEYFWALNNLNLTIKKGETVGIIGPNGSGKSTILKLIAGVTSPTKGTINVIGRVSPLIELAAGFHPELTGRDNIYLNGVILGLSVKEIDKILDEIIEFSELADFIDTPIKHYSSGMYMRLGFSVAVYTKPQILLVDEILAVGDSNFQKKSFAKMRSFKKEGVTIILVSHNLEAVEKFCDKVIYLKQGKIIKLGLASKVVRKYMEEYSIIVKKEMGKKYFEI